MGSTLGAAEWNLNVLQEGNWTQEVLAGTNADKIPGAALASALTLPGSASFLDGLSGNILFGAAAFSDAGRIMSISGTPHLMQNIYYAGGGVFNRDDTSKSGWMFRPGGNVGASFAMLYAAPAANPVAFTVVLDVSQAGKLTGGGFYRSAEVTITTGNSANFTHNFTAGPSFYAGIWGTVSGNENAALAPYSQATAPYYSNFTANVITVSNTTGATAFVLLSAMR